MLIRYAVENFMSFKDQTIFSMAAGRGTHHSDHVLNCAGKRILKGSFIFGSNAGGKSNFIKSVAFAKSIVLKGLKEVSCDNKYFRIDPQYKNKPGSFQFDIFTDGNYYSYGFSVSYSHKIIVEEWLYRLMDSGKDECIFSLVRDQNEKVTIESDLKFQNKDDQQRFNVYSMDIKAPEMSSSLFLSEIAPRSSNSEKFKDFIHVYNWFKRLLILFPSSHFNKMHYIIHGDEIRELLEMYLKYFDTGIEGLDTRKVPIDRLANHMSTEQRQELLTEIEEAFNKSDPNTAIGLRNNDGNSMQIEKKNGEIFTTQLLANHGNNDDLFDLRDESDGTQRLYDLIPIYQKMKEQNLILVDELDRSFHSMLTIEFINQFYNKSCFTQDNYAQLIATTHDSNVLNLDLLRQDEIWFIERSENHCSNLYSLNKFKARYDKDVEKAYLLGRYGAVPVFSQLDNVQED